MPCPPPLVYIPHYHVFPHTHTVVNKSGPIAVGIIVVADYLSTRMVQCLDDWDTGINRTSAISGWVGQLQRLLSWEVLGRGCGILAVRLCLGREGAGPFICLGYHHCTLAYCLCAESVTHTHTTLSVPLREARTSLSCINGKTPVR